MTMHTRQQIDALAITEFDAHDAVVFAAEAVAVRRPVSLRHNETLADARARQVAAHRERVEAVEIVPNSIVHHDHGVEAEVYSSKGDETYTVAIHFGLRRMRCSCDVGQAGAACKHAARVAIVTRPPQVTPLTAEERQALADIGAPVQMEEHKQPEPAPRTEFDELLDACAEAKQPNPESVVVEAKQAKALVFDMAYSRVLLAGRHAGRERDKIRLELEGLVRCACSRVNAPTAVVNHLSEYAGHCVAKALAINVPPMVGTRRAA